MRKQLIGNGILCVLVMAMAAIVCSCQKEQLAKGTFSATMEGYSSRGSKVVFSNKQFHWMLNDTIAATRQIENSSDYSMGRYCATQVSDNNTAILTYLVEDGNSDVTNGSFSGDYYAFSPASIYESPTSVTLPATYSTDAEGNLIGFPMYAKSSSTLLKFKNLCGMVCLQLSTPNTVTYIRKITLTTDQKVNGTFSISGDNDPTLSYTGTPSVQEKSVTLKTLVDISTPHNFFIPLPAGTYPSLVIKIYTADGKTSTLTLGNGNTLNILRSQYTLINLTPTQTFSLNFTRAAGAKGGFFSVSSTQKVQFSQGNLQYRAMDENSAPHHWRFAENQYDHIFTEDWTTSSTTSQITGTYYNADSTHWVDLFLWGSSGKNNFYPHKLDFPFNGITNISKTDNDWGVNCSISNGGNNRNLWRTLTKDEWAYLLNTRDGANEKWAKATVAGTKGLILVPDEWNCPSTIISLTYGTSSRYTSNTIDATTWQYLEALGAIFLPITGYLYPTWYINNTTTIGYYWTSTFSHYNSGSYAYRLSFANDADPSASTENDNALWKRGFAVRLVRNAGSDEL